MKIEMWKVKTRQTVDVDKTENLVNIEKILRGTATNFDAIWTFKHNYNQLLSTFSSGQNFGKFVKTQHETEKYN